MLTQNIDIMSKVNRSTYQKAVEENKKLIADIKLLVEDGLPSAEKALCISKWRKKFKKEKEFNYMMKQVARQYIKDHADELDITYESVDENEYEEEEEVEINN